MTVWPEGCTARLRCWLAGDTLDLRDELPGWLAEAVGQEVRSRLVPFSKIFRVNEKLLFERLNLLRLIRIPPYVS